MAERATYVCVPACDNDDHHPACDGRGEECRVEAASSDSADSAPDSSPSPVRVE